MVLVQFREEWNAIRDIANNAPGVELARAATRALCLIRQNIPYAFDVAATASPGFTPAIASYGLTRAFWEAQCRETPIPASNRVTGGLIGGQCPGVSYTVTGIINNTQLGLPPNNTQQFSITNCTGPLRDVWITVQPGGNGRQYVLNVLDVDDVTPRTQTLGSDNIANPTITNPRFTISPVDNCPPQTQPPTLPVTPPPTSFPVTVNIGSEQRSFTVNLPEFDISNWPQFTFSPTINIGGVTFSFDIGGVNISFEGGTALPPAQTPPAIEQEFESVNNTINNVNNTVNNIENEIENVTNTVNNIENIINNEVIADLTEILNAIKCCCCEENATIEPTTIATGTSGGVFSLPENTIYVVIEGTGFNPNFLRSMEGGGSSSKVWFWGWYAVGYGGSDGGERINLQYESHAIPVSEGASTINVSCYTGTTATITAFTKELNCNEHG